MGCSQSRRLDAATRPVACILGRVVGALYCTLECPLRGEVRCDVVRPCMRNVNLVARAHTIFVR